jgi:hypothetical protein
MMLQTISSHRDPPRKTISLLTIVFILAASVSAMAGTICGTITDGDSGLPVAGAGVFARLPDGTYAGALAVSDPTGHWCITDLVPGTYTLEIRVDNYLTVFRNGIQVTDDVSAVPISVLRPRLTLDPPWPNPAISGVNMRLHVTRESSVEMGIFDLRGRQVRSWISGSVATGSHEYHWNGRDAGGRDVPSGLYFIRLRSGDFQTTRPLVLSR